MRSESRDDVPFGFPRAVAHLLSIYRDRKREKNRSRLLSRSRTRLRCPLPPPPPDPLSQRSRRATARSYKTRGTLARGVKHVRCTAKANQPDPGPEVSASGPGLPGNLVNGALESGTRVTASTCSPSAPSSTLPRTAAALDAPAQVAA